jgi:hypothetical protein
MIKIKSTVVPKDRQLSPHSTPSMDYVFNFWKTEGSNFNNELYLRVLSAKRDRL